MNTHNDTNKSLLLRQPSGTEVLATSSGGIVTRGNWIPIVFYASQSRAISALLKCGYKCVSTTGNSYVKE